MKRYLPDIFYRFGGFLLGGLTVFWTLEHIETIQQWGESIHISAANFPPTYWWVNILINTLTVGFLNVACLLGLFGFLGGLIGAHKLSTGLVICALTIAGMISVGIYIHGYDFQPDYWLFWVAFLLALLSNLFGIWVPYLLGFSIKRLVLLSFFSTRRK